MTGRRLPDDATVLAPGDYGRIGGVWHCKPPLNAKGQSYSGSLRNHTVVEHADGTITVSPSIWQKWGDGEEIWHGFLERGVWRSC